MHERENALRKWIENSIEFKDFVLTSLTGDASFRKYYRLQYKGLNQIVMDAPPGKEDLAPFIHIADVLSQRNVLTPEIIAADQQQGFLLLSDFGDQLLLGALTAQNADNFYEDAIKTLLKIQECPITDPKLPAFNKAFMMQEMNVCNEWFFNAYLSLQLEQSESALIHNTMDWIAEQVSQQPLVFIHRDYHSRNLMLVDNASGVSLGVIDFQDAMSGPITYDLVSLLKDCYIAWPREKILEWLTYFYANHPITRSTYELPDFIRAFDLCGLQRHLKVLGVFSRLHLRDNKPGYLKDLPLTLQYVMECTESYSELQPLYQFFQERVRLP